MDVRKKLVELILNADNDKNLGSYDLYELTHERTGLAEYFADYLIAHGVTVQEWISVENRLPEYIDTYLVVVKYKYDFEKDFDYATDVATYNPYENAYIDDCWCTFNDWDEGQQYLHITHWMPMPQPPKGE